MCLILTALPAVHWSRKSWTANLNLCATHPLVTQRAFLFCLAFPTTPWQLLPALWFDILPSSSSAYEDTDGRPDTVYLVGNMEGKQLLSLILKHTAQLLFLTPAPQCIGRLAVCWKGNIYKKSCMLSKILEEVRTFSFFFQFQWQLLAYIMRSFVAMHSLI